MEILFKRTVTLSTEKITFTTACEFFWLIDDKRPFCGFVSDICSASNRGTSRIFDDLL